MAKIVQPQRTQRTQRSKSWEHLTPSLADFPSGRISGFQTGRSRLRLCPEAVVSWPFFSSVLPKFSAVPAFIAVNQFRLRCLGDLLFKIGKSSRAGSDFSFFSISGFQLWKKFLHGKKLEWLSARCFTAAWKCRCRDNSRQCVYALFGKRSASAVACAFTGPALG